jgi:phosphatidylglycerol phospholipase C
LPLRQCWNRALTTWPQENYIKLCKYYLPEFPTAMIGFSLLYSHRFLKQPDVHFNLLQQTLVGPIGGQFLKAIKKAQKQLFVWTVNEDKWMEWSIRKQVDGVVTDDPQLFLDVCDRWKAARSGATKGKAQTAVVKTGAVKTAKLYAAAALMQVMTLIFTALFWRRLYKGSKQRTLKKI